MIKLQDGTILNNVLEDRITRELNGLYTLTFKMLHDPKINLNIGEIVSASDLIGNLQKFRIVSKTEKNQYIRIFCKHIFFDLNFNVCRQIKIDNKNGNVVMNAFKNSLIEKNNFSFGSDIVGLHTFNIENENSLDVFLKGKHSILGQWGGEIFIDNNIIKLNSSIGVDTEHLFTVNKNIHEIENEENAENLVTRLYLFKKIENSHQKEILSTVVDSPLIEKYPIIYATTIYVDDENVKTLEDLKNYGKEKFKKTLIDIPTNSVKIKVLEDIDLKLGDTAIVLFEKYNILKRLKVVKYNFSPISKKIENIEFGNISSFNLSRTLSEKNTKNIKDVVDENLKNELSKTVDNIKNIIDYEISNINLELDNETIKALTNAEVKSFLISAEGKEKIFSAVTGDIAKLNSIIVNTELLNAVVARMNIAEIKKLIVDSAFINSIISKEEFRQEFEDRGIEVVNIFSKIKDSVSTIINQKILDNNGILKSEMTSVIEQNSNKLSSKIENIQNDIKNLKVGTVNLLNGTSDFSGEYWQFKNKWTIEKESFENLTVLSNSSAWYGIFQEFNVIKNQTYTFSTYVKRDNVGNVILYVIDSGNDILMDIRSKTFSNIGNEFQRISITFTPKENGKIQPRIEKPDANGKIFICGYKLEKGEISTSWSPSIDDLENKSIILQNYILNLETENSDFKKQLNDLISENSKIKNIISSELKQTNDTFEFNFNNFKNLYDENNNLVLEKINDFSKYIRFINGNIEIGEVNNLLTLKIQNDKIQFLQSGVEVAYFSQNKLYVLDGDFINSLRIGKFSFVPRENGNLSFLREGI